MERALIEKIDFLDAESSSKWEFKIFPIFAFEVFKRFFGKKIYMSRILVRFNRSVIGNIYNDPGTGLADAVNFFKELSQMINVFKQMAAEYFVHRAVQKRQPLFNVAYKVDVFR